MRPPGDIFATASDRQVEQALQHFQRMHVDCAEVVMEQMSSDPALLFLLDGRLEIVRDGVVLDVSGPGEVVGEMSVFTRRKRTATVRASEDCDLLVLERSGYEALRDENNEVAYSLERVVIRLLNHRLRRLDRLVAERAAGEANPYAKPEASVFEKMRGFLFGGKPAPAVKPAALDPVAVLEASHLFADERHLYIKVLATQLEQETFSPGEFLTQQGEPGDAVYFIGSGEVDVVVFKPSTDGGPEKIHRLATLGPGNACGLTALADDRPRMASCVARTQVDVLALSREVWEKQFEENSRGASTLRVAMIRAFAGQIAGAQKALVGAVGADDVRLKAGASLEHTGSDEG